MDKPTVAAEGSKSRPLPAAWMLLAIVLGAAALIGGLSWWRDHREHRERPYRELRKAMAEIQIAVERFGMDSPAPFSYPTNLEALIKTGYLRDMPENPFGPGKLKLLNPGDSWEPGGILYVPVDTTPSRQIGKLKTPSESFPWVLPGEVPSLYAEVPIEVGEYILVAYSPRLHRRRKADFNRWWAELPSTRLGYTANENLLGIDWLHVEVMMTSQDDWDVPNGPK